MDDKLVRDDVLEELDFDPSIDATNIGVAVDEGVVTLSGHVSSYAEKIAAECAARRVKGVRAIAKRSRFATRAKRKQQTTKSPNACSPCSGGTP